MIANMPPLMQQNEMSKNKSSNEHKNYQTTEEHFLFPKKKNGTNYTNNAKQSPKKERKEKK